MGTQNLIFFEYNVSKFSDDTYYFRIRLVLLSEKFNKSDFLMIFENIFHFQEYWVCISVYFDMLILCARETEFGILPIRSGIDCWGCQVMKAGTLSRFLSPPPIFFQIKLLSISIDDSGICGRTVRIYAIGTKSIIIDRTLYFIIQFLSQVQDYENKFMYYLLL